MFGLFDATVLVSAATPGVMACAAMACAAMVCAAFFWDGCQSLAQPGLGPVIVASRGSLGGPLGPECLQPYPGELDATDVAMIAELMDATRMAATALGVLSWVATMASMFAATFFQPLCAGERGLGTHTRLLAVSELVRRAMSASSEL